MTIQNRSNEPPKSDKPPRHNLPVNVELVKMRTIFELTGGNVSSEPANIKSTVRSSIVHYSVLNVGDYTTQTHLVFESNPRSVEVRA